MSIHVYWYQVILQAHTKQDGLMDYFDGLVQERRNSTALTKELRLPCTNPSILSSL